MTKPNILFIVLDDLNAWIGALGRHPDAHTPNIDALSRRGALFVHAYCSAPYCNASRMGMFTGRLPSTLGVYVNEPFWDNPDRPLTLMERLRAGGYRTVGAGKVFHGVFDYERALFDRLEHAPWREVENRSSVWDQFTTNAVEPLPHERPLNKLFDFADPASVPDMYRHFDWGPCDSQQEEDLPDVVVVRAIEEFLEQPADKPFFCAAGIYKPHLPWHAPRRFFDMINPDPALPLVRADDLDDAPPIARDWALSPADHELVTSRGVWKDAVRAYLACAAFADALVGRLIDALDRSPFRANTAIIVCGDNGFHLGEKLHWRKFALWEEATRVPLIYVPPGGIPQRRVSAPASLIDIHNTVLALAGLEGQSGDGFDLARAMAGEERPTPVISTWGSGNHSVRLGRWRYTLYSDGAEELFEHDADPHEWTNLAYDPAFTERARELKGMLRRAVGAEAG